MVAENGIGFLDHASEFFCLFLGKHAVKRGVVLRISRFRPLVGLMNLVLWSVGSHFENVIVIRTGTEIGHTGITYTTALAGWGFKSVLVIDKNCPTMLE